MKVGKKVKLQPKTPQHNHIMIEMVENNLLIHLGVKESHIWTHPQWGDLVFNNPNPYKWKITNMIGEEIDNEMIKSFTVDYDHINQIIRRDLVGQDRIGYPYDMIEVSPFIAFNIISFYLISINKHVTITYDNSTKTTSEVKIYNNEG